MPRSVAMRVDSVVILRSTYVRTSCDSRQLATQPAGSKYSCALGCAEYVDILCIKASESFRTCATAALYLVQARTGATRYARPSKGCPSVCRQVHAVHMWACDERRILACIRKILRSWVRKLQNVMTCVTNDNGVINVEGRFKLLSSLLN